MVNIRKFLKNMIVAVATVTVSMAVQAQEPSLAEGEVLYKGTTKLEKCDEVIFSFVLNEKKDTIKHFKVELNGIYINRNGNLTKTSTEIKYFGNYGGTFSTRKVEVKDGGVDCKQSAGGDEFHIIIKQGLGDDIVKGEFNFVYVVNRSPWQNEDLGTAPIEFKKVETK